MRVSIPAVVTTGLTHNPVCAFANACAIRPHTLSPWVRADRGGEVNTGVFRPDGPRPLLASQTCWPRGWHLGTWGRTVPQGGGLLCPEPHGGCTRSPARLCGSSRKGSSLLVDSQETLFHPSAGKQQQEKEGSVCPGRLPSCQCCRPRPLRAGLAPSQAEGQPQPVSQPGGGLWAAPCVPSIVRGPLSSPLDRVESRTSAPSRCG